MHHSNDRRYVFPEAKRPVILDQVDKVVKSSSNISEIIDLVKFHHSAFNYPSHNPNRPNELFDHLRQSLLDTIECKPSGNIAHNDVQAATILYDGMSLDPAQAGSKAMWETLGAFIFPDYAVLRFGDTEKNLRERLVGDPRRNVISRLWFRRHVFSPQIEQAYSSILGQDLVQQYIERPSIASDPRLVQMSLEIIASWAQASSTSDLRSFYREFLKEITLLAGISFPYTMSDTELMTEIRTRGNIANSTIRKQ